jgi:hypothetical protein
MVWKQFTCPFNNLILIRLSDKQKQSNKTNIICIDLSDEKNSFKILNIHFVLVLNMQDKLKQTI